MGYKMFSPYIGRVYRLTAVLVACATLALPAQAEPKKDPVPEGVMGAKVIRASCLIATSPEYLHRYLYFRLGIGHLPVGVQNKLTTDMLSMGTGIHRTAKPIPINRVLRPVSLPPIENGAAEPQDFYEVEVTVGGVTGPMYTLGDCLE